MKLLLDIKDDKALFIIELLKNFKFVKTKALTLANSEMLEGLKEAVEQVNNAKQGKVELKSTRQFLDEI